jgi:SAM-dependent methyltransferase
MRVAIEKAERNTVWDEVGQGEQPSWYLDPLVAAQKREENLQLLRRWTAGMPIPLLLKTDSFEEANGTDEVLTGFDSAAFCLGMDISSETAGRARRRLGSARRAFVAADVLALPLAPGSVDVIFSNSTLDHFRTRAEFESAIAQLVAVLRPGGVFILTLDNCRNPLYWLLRAMSAAGLSPFPLGYVPTPRRTAALLQAHGLSVTDRDHLIHNPRLLSTVLFLVLRKLLGSNADAPIRLLLRLFACCGRLPLRGVTSSFAAFRAVKPATHPVE